MIGLGVASISFGIEKLFGLHLDNFGKVMVMMVLIVAYVISAATGVERGIKILSQTNMILAGSLLVIILFFGHAPTQYLFNMMVQMTGDYFGGLVKFSFWTDAGNFEQRDWLGWWLSLIVLFNIIIFAVTTSDSASFFVAMQMSKGERDPKISMRLLWGVVIGLTGIIFQLTGGFKAIKSLAIVVGAPFFFVGIAFIFSVYFMLRDAKAGKI